MKKPRLLGLGMAAVAVAVALALAGPAAAATPTALLPPTITAHSTTFTVGTAAKFTFRNPPDSIVPARFVYQLNAGAPAGVDATNGRATVSIVPNRFTNMLSVFSVAPDGATSGTTTQTFNAAYPPPAATRISPVTASRICLPSAGRPAWPRACGWHLAVRVRARCASLRRTWVSTETVRSATGLRPTSMARR